MSPFPSSFRLPTWILFPVLYLSWGSTFLATRVANETMPPLMMAGSRFLVAGVLLFAWLVLRGVNVPDVGSWVRACVIGLLLLGLGNGSLSWALVTLPSGTAALFVGTIPVWMVLLERLEPRAQPLRKQVLAGLGLGVAGLYMVTRSIGDAAIFDSALPVPVVVLLFGCAAWAFGSRTSRRYPTQAPLLMSVAMQMFCGGTALFMISILGGEWRAFSMEQVSLRSGLSLGYLVVVGTLIGYSAYAYLLRVSTLSLVGTFAYVNPLVALLLGWAIGGEAVTSGTLGGAAVILSGVILMKVEFGPIFDRLLVRVPVAPRRTLTAVRSRGSRTETLIH